MSNSQVPADQKPDIGRKPHTGNSNCLIDELNERLTNAGLQKFHLYCKYIDLSGVTKDDLILNISAHQAVSKLAFEYFTELKDPKAFALQLACRYNWHDVVGLLLQNKVPIDDPQQKKEEYSPLVIAAFYNFTSIVKILIENKADVTKVDPKGKTALHLAAQHGNEELCEVILNQPHVNVNEKDRAGKTPLHLAMLAGERGKKVTSLLIAEGADIMMKDQDKGGRCALQIAAGEGAADIIEMLLNEVPEEGKEKIQDEMTQALFMAVQGGYEKAVKTMIDQGAKVNAVQEGKTPLHIAAINGQLAVSNLLLSRNANANATDNRNMTPFHRACLCGHLEIVKMDVWQNSRYINAVDERGNIPIMLAIFKGRNDVVDYLIDMYFKLGVKLDVTDKKGYNILHKAIEGKQSDTLQLILKKAEAIVNGLINGKDKKERTPLHHAAYYDNEKLVDLLITHGAHINDVDDEKQTPLHIASKHGYINCIQSLMKAHTGKGEIDYVDAKGHIIHQAASFNQSENIKCHPKQNDFICGDKNGYTPLHYAADQGGSKTMEVILEECSDINSVSDKKETPLHLACRRNCVDCVKLLLDKGADISIKTTGGKTCLDEAAEQKKNNICTLLITHKTTLEIIRNDKISICSVETLIKKYPSVMKELLDQCHKKETSEYLFGILDKIEEKTGRRVYFAPAIMDSYSQDDLITHDVTVQLILRKWNRFGRWIYFIWFLINAIYTTFLTALVVNAKEEESKNTTGNVKRNVTCKMTKSTESQAFPWVILFMGIAYMLIQLVYIYNLKLRYLTVGNIWKLLISIFTFLFILPFVACQINSIRELMKGRDDLQWQFGALAILLSWINLLFHFKHLFYGIYVEMLTEVLKSWIKIVAVFGILIIGFALSFHCVLDEKQSFRSPGIAIIKTIVWMIGEFQYDDTFLNSTLKYRSVSLFILIVFFIIMNITFINLLVGLAVGDIDAVRKKAFLILLKEKIHAVEVLLNCMPAYLRKRWHENEYTLKAGMFGGIFDRFGNVMMTKLQEDHSLRRRNAMIVK